MSESSQPSSLPAEPRLPGVERAPALRVLAALDEELSRFTGSVAYQYWEPYAMRGHMRFALGAPVSSVLDDFWMAARTLAQDPGMHLGRYAPEQLLTRRIIPAELGVLGGEIVLAKRMAISFGFPLATSRAGLGDYHLQTEARILSAALVGEGIRDPNGLVGLAAVCYSAALSASIRGYADEVMLALQILADATYDGELSPGHRGAMVRYTGLCEAILELVQPGHRNLPGILADQIERYTVQLQARIGDEYARPTVPQRYMDTAVVSIMAVAAFAGYSLETFPPDPTITPRAVGYADFLGAMGEARQLPADPDALSVEELTAAVEAATGANQDPMAALRREAALREERANPSNDDDV